ncbi:hypothetical protein K458DRAFT_426180 [Lentithecium fluviatile CBS 122367]|uniref:ASST-domain-containing protein n=1 Tax=Lentithecium fluviatile CBS 122367 TaxID=1168545 RepID=A0A6G1JKI4_9PLEO|nr:hypothetical protein K458DRAFT_426180 [Lentithecium fluviatile CBS 122367]
MHALGRRQSSNITWPFQTFVSEPTFLPPIPEVNKTKATAQGYQFFAQQGTGCAQQAAMIMTDDGELVWQSNPKSPFPATNFSPQTLNGKPVLVYNMAVGAPIVESGALTYSTVQIFDDTYMLLHNVSVKDPTFTFAAGNWSSLIDSHEAYITTRNTLIVPAYNITSWDLSPVGGPKEGYLMDSVFYEVTIPDGEILYTWRSSDQIAIIDSYVELDAVYGYGNTTGWAWDYFHINSIQALGEDGYLVSARNTFDVLFVNKTTNSIQWRLRGKDGGDFALDEEGEFSWQHDARLHEHDGELLLSIFDNKNTLTPPFVPSEGHLLSLDLEAKTAKIKTVYVDRNANVAAQFAGSMQVNFKDDGEKFVVVGHGSQPVTEEYDLDGTLRMSWRFGPADPNAASPGIASYRAYKTTWKGYPTTSPAVKACKTASGTDIFVSWNGATEVTGWTVYAGQSEYDMAESISVLKTGFETKISLDAVASMVKVQAKGEVQDERFSAKSSMAVTVQEC